MSEKKINSVIEAKLNDYLKNLQDIIPKYVGIINKKGDFIYSNPEGSEIQKYIKEKGLNKGMGSVFLSDYSVNFMNRHLSIFYGKLDNGFLIMAFGDEMTFGELEHFFLSTLKTVKF